MPSFLRTIAALPLLACLAPAQSADANYDESRVGTFSLPDPLVLSGGERVKTAADWEKRRRPEILRLFETNVYGRTPGKPAGMAFELTSADRKALGGTAVRNR